jgi:hypothetical protein
VVQEIEELRPELQGHSFACRNLETLCESGFGHAAQVRTPEKPAN